MDAGDTTQEFSICEIHFSVSQRELFYLKCVLYPTEMFTFLSKIHSYSQYQINVYERGMPHLY